MSLDHRPLRVRSGRSPQVILSRVVYNCVVALLTAAVGAAGCRGDATEDPGRTSGSPGDSGGAGAVVILAAEAEDPDPPIWRLADSLSVGALEGDLAFGRIADVAPRAAGGMWVLDAQNRTAYGVDESGGLVTSIGGAGEGPGELGNPTGVFEADDGRIAVTESYPPALHWFDSKGSYLETVYTSSAPGGVGGGSPPPLGTWMVMPDGDAFVHLWSIPMPGAGPEVRHSLLRIPAADDGRPVADSLLEWDVEVASPDPMAELKLVQAQPVWAVGTGPVIWWTPGDPYELRRFTSGGHLERIVEVPGDGVQLDDALRSKIKAYMLRLQSPGSGGYSVMSGMLDRAIWPESLPRVARLWVSDPRGRVFAARYDEGLFDDPLHMRIDVFDPDGSYEGRLDLPGGFTPRRFVQGAVYGVARDELDVSYAVRYQLLEPE